MASSFLVKMCVAVDSDESRRHLRSAAPWWSDGSSVKEQDVRPAEFRCCSTIGVEFIFNEHQWSIIDISSIP